MSCEKMKLLLVDMLYDEMGDDDRKWAKNHLTTCRDCSAEYSKLREISHALKRWEEEHADMNLVFIEEKSPFWERLLSKLDARGFGLKQLAFGTIAGALIIVLFVGLIKTEATYRNGEWNITFADEKTRTEELDKAELLAEFERIQRENLVYFNQMILASEERLRKQNLQSMSKLAGTIDFQRRKDLMLIGQSFMDFQTLSEGRLVRTNELLDELFKLTSYGAGGTSSPVERR